MEETPNEGSGNNDEKSLKMAVSDSFSIGISCKSSQQPIFKRKLETYESISPELKALVDLDHKQEMGFSRVV